MSDNQETRWELRRYVIACADCNAALYVEWRDDRIEHNADGSHTFIPSPEREVSRG